MRRKPDCGFDMNFVRHVLELLILICVCIKSDVSTLELLYIVGCIMMSMMCRPMWPFLLMYVSRDTRRIDFPQVDS